jgi:hypothetical protein
MIHLFNMPKRFRTKAMPGFVVVSMVVLLAVAMTLFGLWAKAAVREYRQLEYRQQELQATRLAEAGVGRGMARLASDPAYEGETWTIPAADLDRPQGAEVHIRVVPSPDADQPAHVEATADFPAGAVRRARHTKKSDIPSPSPPLENQS